MHTINGEREGETLLRLSNRISSSRLSRATPGIENSSASISIFTAIVYGLSPPIGKSKVRGLNFFPPPTNCACTLRIFYVSVPRYSRGQPLNHVSVRNLAIGSLSLCGKLIYWKEHFFFFNLKNLSPTRNGIISFFFLCWRADFERNLDFCCWLWSKKFWLFQTCFQYHHIHFIQNFHFSP